MHLSKYVTVSLVVGIALSLAACGGKDEKKEAEKDTVDKKEEKKEGADDKKADSEKASGKKVSQQIIGKWNLDTGDTISKMEAEAETEEEKQALEFAKAMISEMDMRFEFTSDGKMLLTMTAGDMSETQEGTYEVKSEDAASVVIAGTLDDETKDVTIKLVEDDKIEMIMPEEDGPGSMVLTRVK